MQPRFATQASAAALSTIAKTVEWPLGNETGTSSTNGGWFAGTRFWWKNSPSTPGSPWKVSDPRSGEGYESAVAYAVATKLGFKSTDVVWKYVPFNRAFAPGSKPFDFDINQISYTPARAKVVTFSNSYYDENQ